MSGSLKVLTGARCRNQWCDNGRFRSQGMARALLATALAQALDDVNVMIAWKQCFEILILSGFLLCGSDRLCCFGKRRV